MLREHRAHEAGDEHSSLGDSEFVGTA